MSERDPIEAAEDAYAGHRCSNRERRYLRPKLRGAIAAYLREMRDYPPECVIAMMSNWENMVPEDAVALWRHQLDEVLAAEVERGEGGDDAE